MDAENRKVIDRAKILTLLNDAEDGDTIPLMVTGMSMMPFLFHKQSIVYLKKDRTYCPRKGDIVFFVRRDLAPVLHRIVKVRKDGVLVIKGDAQYWREEIEPYQILAHVTHIIRKEKLFSVESRLYRSCVKLWMPFRLLHPPLSFCIHICNRISYKLSRWRREKHS